jgi:hypothetical protein
MSERDIIIAEIKRALEGKVHQLRDGPGRCEKCPEGPCNYCELRGCLALLQRLQPNPEPAEAARHSETAKGCSPRPPLTTRMNGDIQNGCNSDYHARPRA